MTDHIGDANKMDHIIIAAAQEAEAYATSQTADIVDWKAIAQERFWAIAYRQGMERAAEIARSEWKTQSQLKYGIAVSDAIHAEAHAQNPPKNVHDTAVVYKK